MTSKVSGMSAVQGMIFERLVEAMETDIAMPARIGPKSFGSAMPDYIHTGAENFARDREDQTETGGQRKREDEKAERRKIERRRRCSPERISRMEEAFDWIRKYIFDDEARQVLLAYIEVKARGWEWGRYLNSRNRKNPQKSPWIKRTVQRWIVRSLQIIEEKTSQSGIIWNNPEGLQVAHEEAKHAGKSISSGLYAWMAPDGKPASLRT